MEWPPVVSRDLTVITQLSQRKRTSKTHTTAIDRNRWQSRNARSAIYGFRPDLDTEWCPLQRNILRQRSADADDISYACLPHSKAPPSSTSTACTAPPCA